MSETIKKNKDILTLIFLILFGILYGTVFNFQPQEIIFYGKIRNQINIYDFDNPFFKTSINDEISLTYYISYFLIKIGINNSNLNFITSGITSALSIISIFYFSKIFIKSNFYNSIIVMILLYFKFTNTRWYGISYPNSFFYFGQSGMYLTILSFSLFFFKKKNLSTSIMILTFFSHLAWGFFNLFLLILSKLITKEKIFLNNKNILLIIFLIITTVFIHLDLKKNSLNYEISNSQNANLLKIEEKNNANRYTTNHNVKFIENNIFSTLFNILRFFFFDALIVIIFILYYKKLSKLEINIFKIIFYSTIVIYSIIIFYVQILEGLFKLHPYFAILFDRIHISRFLNFNNIFIILFITSKIFEQKNIFITYSTYCLFLSLIINNIFFYNYKIGYLSYNDLAIYSLIFVTSFFIKKNSQNYNYNKKIILILFFLSFFPFLHFQYSNSKKIYSSNKELFLKIKESNNTLLLGGKIWGNVDPTEFIKNPILVMTNPQFLPYLDKKYVKVYCNDQNLTFDDQDQYFNYINKECFKKKTTQEWQDIKNRLNIKYVLTISEVDLNLEKIGKNELYNLYKIN
jgi:hypothetical protein